MRAPSGSPARSDIQVQWATFAELTPSALYALLRLRAHVFVVEQQCAFADLDGQDEQAWHLLLWWDGALAGYARMFPPPEPGTAVATPANAPSTARSAGQVSVGRIVTPLALRGQGLGQRLMEELLRHSARHFPAAPVRMGAQSRLQKFYAGYGFVVVGSAFLEDGIVHVPMLRAPELLPR
ncbi:MAG: GNAT family N-acetyltransferase [Oceanococcaceae bacterium]